MSAEDWWGLAWVLSGLPFAVVCTAQGRRDGDTWAWLIPGVCIGLMCGPMSLLMIGEDAEDRSRG